MKKTIVIGLSLALTGCTTVAGLQTTTIDPGTVPGSDYHVAFVNRSDFTFNGDVLEDRQRVITVLVESDACPKPTMISEKAMQWGTWGLGNPRITYYSEWRCK